MSTWGGCQNDGPGVGTAAEEDRLLQVRRSE